MNGATILAGPSIGVIPNDWAVVGIADFNGDAKADILWRHNTGIIG
jgi:translation initiation factor IF-1